jgi:hypothetical protein
MKIAITGTDTSFATLQISNAHFGAAQTTPPVIATPTNCGTTPTVTLAPGSTDNAGSFTITSGTGGTASTCDTTLTFRRPYAATPKSILLSSKTSAASAARQPYVSAESATNFTLSFGNSAAGANNTPYTFSYWAVE